jgi:hypothetical protein
MKKADDFINWLPSWLSELRQRAEERNLSLKTEGAGGKSYNFQIEGNQTCAVGRTHNTRQSTRNKSYINLSYSDECRWKEQQESPFDMNDSLEVTDVFAIVIDHQSSGNYQQEHDDFLVLDEEILREIPESGNKAFRITSTGYRDPFDRHQNSWERLFENIQ